MTIPMVTRVGLTDSFPRLKFKLESIEGIGGCRAVWVPGQDLATPHLMHNCRKRILSLRCMLYVHLCVRKCAYSIYGV